MPRRSSLLVSHVRCVCVYVNKLINPFPESLNKMQIAEAKENLMKMNIVQCNIEQEKSRCRANEKYLHICAY